MHPIKGWLQQIMHPMPTARCKHITMWLVLYDAEDWFRDFEEEHARAAQGAHAVAHRTHWTDALDQGPGSGHALRTLPRRAHTHGSARRTAARQDLVTET